MEQIKYHTCLVLDLSRRRGTTRDSHNALRVLQSASPPLVAFQALVAAEVPFVALCGLLLFALCFALRFAGRDCCRRVWCLHLGPIFSFPANPGPHAALSICAPSHHAARQEHHTRQGQPAALRL